MSTQTERKANLCTVGLGLLAVTAGGAAPALAQPRVSRVSCRFTSASSTNIDSQDGFANALETIAESVCDSVSGETSVTPIATSIAGVASAMAEAVASVTGQCSGVGTAQVMVNAVARAEAQAMAVGRASAQLLANSEVCGSCESTLNTLVESMETVAATAVASVTVDDSFVFSGNTITVSEVERVVEENILELIASITGEVRASTDDGCSIFANNRIELNSDLGSTFAECDTSISADDIRTEIDAVADAGSSVAAMACEDAASLNVTIIAEQTAVAVAQAIAQADAFCESNGNAGTMACALSEGSVRAIASAQATAFVTAMAEAIAPDCDCDLTASLSATDVEVIFAEAAASAFVEICVMGSGSDIALEFVPMVEETIVEVLAEAIAVATASPECTVGVESRIEFQQEE